MAAPHWFKNVREEYGQVGGVVVQKKSKGWPCRSSILFVMGLKARMRSCGCLVSISFNMDLNDSDHSWQLTLPTCRAFSILKIMHNPLSVQKPPAVLGLSKNKFIL